MKRTSSVLLAVLCTALLLLPPGRALAQSNAKPPTQLTYQGFLTDGNGLPFGNSAPVNKTVIFRIYDALTGGTLKWSSQQVVTVDKGYFSVLLGQGSAGPEGSSLFNADLTGIFTGAGASDRYLELTADGTTIAPRLRFLPAPYAMLAKSATELLDPVTGASALSVSGGGISGSGASLTSLNASQITSGTLNNARTTATSANTANAIVARDASGNFSANIGTFGYAKIGQVSEGFYVDSGNLALRAPSGGATFFQNSGGARTDMFIANNGNVGIGTTSPASRLHVSGGDIQMSGGNFFMDNAKIFYAKNAAGSHEPFLWPRWTDNIFYLNYGSGGFHIRNNNSTSAMFLTSAGNVGIGTTSPTATLQVNTTTSYPTPGIALVGSGGDMMMSLQNTSAGGRNWNLISAGTGSGVPGALRFYDSTGGGDRMVIKDNGYVGIGTTSPDWPLTVQSDSNPYIIIKNSNGNYSALGRSGGDLILTLNNAGNGTRYARYDGDQNWDFLSDRRLKKDIVDAESMLDRALKVQVRRYRWNEEDSDAKHKLGVIAQEVQLLFPDLVDEFEDPKTKENMLTVGYGDFATIAIKALQEFKQLHDAEVSDLKARLAELEQENQKLQSSNLERDRRLVAIEQFIADQSRTVGVQASLPPDGK